MSTNNRSYYGPLFWVSIVSFLVPLIVAAKAFHQVAVTTKPTPQPDVSGVDHALWDYLLKTYVADGLVDYDGLARDHLFRTYLLELSEAVPEKLATSADKLALLCNAYNAFVMDGVITHKIRDSVMSYQRDGTDFFAVEEHIFAGRTMSLNHIEHTLIREQFQEPRVHVALVCAARSCPAIRAEAYVGKRIFRQLEDQSIQFANNSKYCRLDSSTHALTLSPLLDWYGKDWETVGGYLPWLAERVRDPVLKQAVQDAAAGMLPVVFSKYNWSLNSQQSDSDGATSAEPGGAGFGSGSIPNQ